MAGPPRACTPRPRARARAGLQRRHHQPGAPRVGAPGGRARRARERDQPGRARAARGARQNSPRGQKCGARRVVCACRADPSKPRAGGRRVEALPARAVRKRACTVASARGDLGEGLCEVEERESGWRLSASAAHTVACKAGRPVRAKHSSKRACTQARPCWRPRQPCSASLLQRWVARAPAARAPPSQSRRARQRAQSLGRGRRRRRPRRVARLMRRPGARASGHEPSAMRAVVTVTAP